MRPGAEGGTPAAPEPLQSDLLLQPIFSLEPIDDCVQALPSFAHERQALVRDVLVRVTHFRTQRTNEEFLSVNEELYTVNREYQHKMQELMQLNDDIGNLLCSTNIGTIFLATTLQVPKFTPASTSVVSLMPQDIGPSVTHWHCPVPTSRCSKSLTRYSIGARV